jgi:hypothetical protein
MLLGAKASATGLKFDSIARKKLFFRAFLFRRPSQNARTIGTFLEVLSIGNVCPS